MYGRGPYNENVRPIPVRNMTNETIPAYACMMRYKAYDFNEIRGRGTERIGGIETVRVEKCTEQAAALQESWQFLFNGPTPIPPGEPGTGTLDFPALVLHEPAFDDPIADSNGTAYGNEWLYPGEGCGPVAYQWFVSSKYFPPGKYWRRGSIEFDGSRHPNGWAFRSLGHIDTWGKNVKDQRAGATDQPENHPIWVTRNDRQQIVPVYAHGYGIPTFSVEAGGYFCLGNTGIRYGDVTLTSGLVQYNGTNFYRMTVPRWAIVQCTFNATIWASEPERGDLLRVAVEHWRAAKPGETSTGFPDGGAGYYVDGCGAAREQDVEQDGYYQDIQVGKENVSCSGVFGLEYNDRIYLKNESSKTLNLAVAGFTAIETSPHAPPFDPADPRG